MQTAIRPRPSATRSTALCYSAGRLLTVASEAKLQSGTGTIFEAHRYWGPVEKLNTDFTKLPKVSGGTKRGGSACAAPDLCGTAALARGALGLMQVCLARLADADPDFAACRPLDGC